MCPIISKGKAKVKGPELLVDIFNFLFLFLLNNNFPQPLILQIISDVLILIDVTTFNTLLVKPEFCSCGRGIDIKMNLVPLDEWLSKMKGMGKAKMHLSHIRDAAGALSLMDHTVCLSPDYRKEAIPSLTEVQLVLLLINVQADMFVFFLSFFFRCFRCFRCFR